MIMELHKKLFFCITWLILLYIIGILLFTKGFLLTRFVIRNNSSCAITFANDLNDTVVNYTNGCWTKPLRKRAIFIVIDALRFDFVAFRNLEEKSKLLPYENKLHVIQQLVKNNPHNARLYKFMADPPTTTLQRLKGLTTGSLPTFIDVASNFDSSAISEDNFIDQFVDQNKSIIFMGDDTWANLFPGRFRRAFPYPSFNVKDLHTVDNGVMKHLIPELQMPDWDILIAHFLGVDHCGHRYGPNHPAMADKLKQMDNMLRSVIELLDEDTILFVFGDHGMTKTGDHGGDSGDELEAALFVYSKAPLTQSEKQKETEFESISQTDLVPTVSLLLGVPIPFSNLGTIITDLFNISDGYEGFTSQKIAAEFNMIKALRLNANQVRRFIQTYASVSDEFSVNVMADLELKFTQLEDSMKAMTDDLRDGHLGKVLAKLASLRDHYKLYLSHTRTMCQDIWAKFDLSFMVLGIVLTICSVVLSIYWLLSLAVSTPFQWQPIVLGCVSSFWIMSFISLLSVFHLSLPDTLLSLAVIFGFIIIFGILAVKLTMDQTHVICIPWSFWHIEYVPVFIILVYSISLFSNSYIVFEDATSAYFLQSLVIYTGWCVVCRLYDLPKVASRRITKKHKVQSFDLVRQLTSPIALTVNLVIAINLLIRLSSKFRACREEQWSCVPSTWLFPLSSLTEDLCRYKNVRYFFSVGCLACFVVTVNKWLQYWGNLNGYVPCVVSMRYFLPIGAVSLGLYWALQAMPSKLFDSLPVWQVTFFPRVVYVVVLVIWFSVMWKPLCLFVLSRKPHNSLSITKPVSENILPEMYNHIKTNWKEHLHCTSIRSEVAQGTSNMPPVVYGLVTVFSASHLVLMSAFVLLLFMLLGDNYSPSLLMAFGIMALLLELNAALVEVTDRSVFQVPWSAVILWSLLASEHFYSTGHQTVVTTIQWQSAFHGFHGDFHYYIIPASLILINTFASHILTVISLPLVLFWPRVRHSIIFLFDKYNQAREPKDSRGEYLLHEDNNRLWSGVFQLFVGYITIQGLKVLATMCCAMIHRRHLMVWKIFAPRFLFEGTAFLLIGPLSLITYLFVIRVNEAVKKWIKSLDEW